MFVFFNIAANMSRLWAFGGLRFAGAFAVVERQSECGSKTAGMHVSQPINKACIMPSFFFYGLLKLTSGTLSLTILVEELYCHFF
jgi:hypothetical protein